MQARTIRRWSWVHKWTSLVSMAFLLMLCITGLPLIFKHELDHLIYEEVEPAEVPPGTPMANVDKIAAAGMERNPGKSLQFIIWDREHANEVFLSIGETPTSDPSKNVLARVDAFTGTFLDQPDYTGRITYILYRLHVDMFAGLAGKLFLGLMGLLFVIAVVSGIVVYAPPMRKLPFGTVRSERSRLLRWFDLHNLLGAVTLMWAVVVGFTGVINTWADIVLKIWQFGQLTEMVGPYKGKPVPEKLTSLQSAVDSAKQTAPGMIPSFIAFPGTPFTSSAHYAVFMRGDTPLTSRLLKPVLIDASTGKVTDSRNLPWYVTSLLVSQPLHFGDYGGMPLKIIWGVLDVLTIVVLGSGLYLWLKRRSPRASRRKRQHALAVPGASSAA
jgi:uncharacterized iron-regulated membrane protein